MMLNLRKKTGISLKGISVTFIYLFMIALTSMVSAGQQACIVMNAQDFSKLRIVNRDNANAFEKSVANTFTEYLYKSLGIKVPVITEYKSKNSSDKSLIRIHLGNTQYAKKYHKLELKKDNMDGFIIAFPNAQNIIIVGVTDYGTEFGVYEFLERYLGIRWLFPGELGEYIPKLTTLTISTVEVQQQPAFFSRLLSDERLWGERQNNSLADWAYRNRMHGTIKFHHNLFRIFPAMIYTKNHPEFFPIFDGKRFLPKDNKFQDWQPCFSEPGTISEAIKHICSYFKNHPNATSFSLGINDSKNYCQCKKCTARYGNKLNSLELKDYSNIYYDWCNKVIEGVLKQYPDKYFGCLAYYNVVDPPTDVKINDRLIAYICYDRLQWMNKQISEKGQQRTKNWAKSSPVFGWYDYIYGRHYSVPRIYFNKMAEVIRFAYDNNVRAFYAEAYPDEIFTEGPKLYIILKLLWDPGIDVNRELKHWNECAVGKNAAPFLAEYFAFWNKFWTEKVPHCGWFKDNGGYTYLNFKSNGYLDLLTEDDLVKCETLLKKTLKHAGAGKETGRAKFFLDGFEKIKKNIAAYLADRKINKDASSVKAVATVHAKSFDTGLDSWFHWQKNTSKASFKWDKNIGRSNTGALAVDTQGANGNTLCFLNNIKIQNDKQYHASVWCKTKDLSANATISLVVKWKNKNGKWLSDAYQIQTYLKNTQDADWQQMQIHFKPPANTPVKPELMVYMLIVKGATKGKVWFDDVSLSEVKVTK